MSASTGYYSIIQYCPDPSRLEAANVGVVLLCPERNYLGVRTAKGNDRIRRFFGSEDNDWAQINTIKLSIQRRLEVERDQIRSAADLERFAATRANAMRLTPPRAVRITEPDADLKHLFERLVGGRIHRETSELSATLEKVFAAEPLASLVRREVQVTLPVFHRPIRVPFGFPNGRFNLIQPSRFQGLNTTRILQRAGQYAIEGELLYQTPDAVLGELQLIVVGQFGPDQREVARAVGEVLRRNETQLYRMDELDRLRAFILTPAKPTCARDSAS
jgi:hypothetical protein